MIVLAIVTPWPYAIVWLVVIVGLFTLSLKGGEVH
jgi:hypothetical protein